MRSEIRAADAGVMNCVCRSMSFTETLTTQRRPLTDVEHAHHSGLKQKLTSQSVMNRQTDRPHMPLQCVQPLSHCSDSVCIH